MIIVAAVCVALVCAATACGVVTTPAFSQVGKSKVRVSLNRPNEVAISDDGKWLAIANTGANQIILAAFEEHGRAAKILRVFGDGRAALKDGAAQSASFNRPLGLGFAGDKIYVCDTLNYALRQIDTTNGMVTTLVGDGKKPAVASSGHGGKFGGGLAQIELDMPWDIACEAGDKGKLYIATAGTHPLWIVDLHEGVAQPLTASGKKNNHLDADWLTDASVARPSGLASDGVGKIYLIDSERDSVQVVDLNEHSVKSLVGPSGAADNEASDTDGTLQKARLNYPLGVAISTKPSGYLYLADSHNHKIKVVDMAAGRVRTIAGTGKSGNQDGVGRLAQFAEPRGIALGAAYLYVADTQNNAIRYLSRIELATDKVGTLELRK